MEQGKIGKLPPYNEEAEKSVLGSMILDKNAINVAAELLRAEDFYDNRHAEIYDTIIHMSNRNIPIDYITLSDELRIKGQLDNIGGIGYLISLSESVVVTSHIEQYCNIVSDKSLLRQLIHTSDAIMAKSYQDSSVGEVIDFAESEIYKITQNKHESGLIHIRSTLDATINKMEEMSLRKGELTGITTGLLDLDRQLSGMQNSDLLLLAARPSMGKTALGVNIAVNAAMKGYVVAIFSLEMSRIQLNQRMISSLSVTNLQHIVSGNIDDWVRVGNAISILSNTNLYVDDTAGLSLTEMRSKCRRLKSEQGLDLVMVDYLQLMTVDQRSENRQQEISIISRGLKGLAKELNCPVLALSQLSRGPETRSDRRPMLSDLRESGAIEQDADVVMLLYRDDYYHEDSERPNTADLIIAKHRNGPTGMVELYFNREITKFGNLIKMKENE